MFEIHLFQKEGLKPQYDPGTEFNVPITEAQVRLLIEKNVAYTSLRGGTAEINHFEVNQDFNVLRE